MLVFFCHPSVGLGYRPCHILAFLPKYLHRDLTILMNQVNSVAFIINKDEDPLVTNILSHIFGMSGKVFDEYNLMVRGHVKANFKRIVSLRSKCTPKLRAVVNQVLLLGLRGSYGKIWDSSSRW